MFYTITELKTLLKLSSSQLYALIDSGKLKCHRFTTGKSRCDVTRFQDAFQDCIHTCSSSFQTRNLSLLGTDV